MTATTTEPTADRWPAIERERRRDRLVRRLCIAAWSVTFGLVLVLGVIVAMSVAHAMRAAQVGVLPWTAVFDLAMPFILVLGVVFLLIATLCTVGVFLRMRTTTLGEIQLRLAALERMLAASGTD